MAKTQPKLAVSTEFVIEKNIAITRKSTGFKSSKYPFHQMEVGDSFWAEKRKGIDPRSAAVAHGDKYGKKFATRAIDGGIRIWRVE